MRVVGQANNITTDLQRPVYNLTFREMLASRITRSFRYFRMKILKIWTPAYMSRPVNTFLNNSTGNQENSAFSTDCTIGVNGNWHLSPGSGGVYSADELMERAVTSTAGKRSLLKFHWAARDANFVHDVTKISTVTSSLNTTIVKLLWDSGTPFELATDTYYTIEIECWEWAYTAPIPQPPPVAKVVHYETSQDLVPPRIIETPDDFVEVMLSPPDP